MPTCKQALIPHFPVVTKGCQSDDYQEQGVYSPSTPFNGICRVKLKEFLHTKSAERIL